MPLAMILPVAWLQLSLNSLTSAALAPTRQPSPHHHLPKFNHSFVSDSLQPHESQHSRPPCPSPTPRVYSDSCPLSWWCHPAISSSVIPFSSCPQSLPASGSFPMSQLFAWGGHSTRVSASASGLPMDTQDCLPISPQWPWVSVRTPRSSFSSFLI